ncbi:hypothetical protein OE749_06350 [Aestuariibacter sp. AA17]|uniref:Uncharacterized protein n=1 Tax=Fluctibacter corallii TaxID=2984329 RepID=A0ABT3A7L8_9ALTE|nr:hypothetical protein [Aestuariibacter sp. AA17]MCV2884311.1 hypothetical protein [Aestuariibacter sp. AA17]
MYHSHVSAGEILVVGNKALKYEQLSTRQLRAIYMGNARHFDVQPLNYPKSHPLRTIFNLRVIGYTEQRIQTFWAQMMFTGKGYPPDTLKSESAAAAFLMNSTNAVAFIDSSSVGKVEECCKILHRFHYDAPK